MQQACGVIIAPRETEAPGTGAWQTLNQSWQHRDGRICLNSTRFRSRSPIGRLPQPARNWRGRQLVLLLLIASLIGVAGCRVLGPMPIDVQSQHFSAALIDADQPQIEIGKPRPIIDRIGWVVGIPDKLLLWDRRIDRHKISEETILATACYLEDNHLPHVKVRANQYAPLKDWKRLTQNKTISWPTRYTFGAFSVAGEAILPGRIFGGDHFNPFTQTVHLYSDIPAIALHEAAHAKDFSRREHQDLYAAAYLFLPIWHETIASEDVFAYLQDQGDREQIAEAHRILYPAYGTYVGSAVGGFGGSYALPVYFAGVTAGHINGRMLARALPGPAVPAAIEHAMLTSGSNPAADTAEIFPASFHSPAPDLHR